MSEVSGEVVDVLGNVVNAGDTVAGAFRIGNTAVLRVGRVLGFGERGNKLTVRVEWLVSSRKSEGNIVGGIEADLNRFVKLTGGGATGLESVLPAEVPEVNEEVPAINP
jgi:hypothetical protein